MPKEKILVIAAHPDDEILGAGGTMLKHMDSGAYVYCVILGEGITSRYPKREQANPKELKKLHEDLRNVARFMGMKQAKCLELPDNRFDSLDLLDIVKMVEKEISKVKPDVIYTHYQYDLNIDHRITFQAVITACRPGCFSSVKGIYSFFIPSSTDWSVDKKNVFHPNTFVNIKKYIDKKAKAMDMYSSEKRTFPHPRSRRAIKVSAQYWGVASGLDYAEPFVLIRKTI